MCQASGTATGELWQSRAWVFQRHLQLLKSPIWRTTAAACSGLQEHPCLHTIKWMVSLTDCLQQAMLS
jgi:hypothetical protein